MADNSNLTVSIDEIRELLDSTETEDPKDEPTSPEVEDIPKEEVPEDSDTTGELDEEDSEDIEGTDDDDDEIPELDPSVTDPQARKRWAEQWKGYQKKVAKLEKEKEAFKKQAEAVEGLTRIGEALQNPATYKQTLQQIIQAVASEHKVSIEDILGSSQIAEDDDPTFDDTDKVLLQRATELALKALEQKYGASLEELSRQSKAAKEDQELKGKVQQAFTKLRDKVSKLNDGFVLTEQMLAQAIKNHPNVDPFLAVKREFVEEIISHRTTAGKKTKAPEMAKSKEPTRTSRDLTNPYSKSWTDEISDLINQY